MAIQILPEAIANQIAAGEVVERPASVVKELVENSIDAGASRILIEIEGAGKKLIKVTDNGSGMSPDDAQLAFARHATSKVIKLDDLEGIKTLGFRGEALPSIGSIARVRLSTANENYDTGLEVAIEGGGTQKVKQIACPQGTTIEVAQIFYNTPARQKFMKGDSTETSYITQVVTQQALAHPEIHFTLNHNGRKVLDTLPTDQLLYRIAEVFGSEMTKELIQVEECSEDYQLKGYISSPVYTRSNRNAQYCFVNQRYIRDKVLLHATQQGYSHLLPKGQHPVLFLFLSMDPKLLDVNVHPAKAEVRFAFQQGVHRFISDGVRNALRKNEKGLVFTDGQNELQAESPASVGTGGKSSSSGTGWGSSANTEYQRPAHGDFSKAIETFYGGSLQTPNAEGFRPSGDRPEVYDQKPTPVSDLIYSEYQPLGQLDNSFIILQGPRGVVIIDQHIAHERVLYERFREASHNKKVEVQKLLFPVTVEFTPAEAQLLSVNIEELKGLGLELEIFGENGFLLRSVPALLKNDDHAQVLREIVEALPRNGSNAVLEDKFDEIIIMMSCRNAITINQPLGLDQINKLIYDLEQTQMPYTCPHGRPIALFFDINDILKKFQRK